jgi:hypothetical protein
MRLGREEREYQRKGVDREEIGKEDAIEMERT